MEAVVADLDGDLSLGQVGSDEGGLDFDGDLFPGVQDVPAQRDTLKHTQFSLLTVNNLS